MTHDEFNELVMQMRKAQKEFFATRSKETLRICKNLERIVDEYIKYNVPEIIKSNTPEQKELF